MKKDPINARRRPEGRGDAMTCPRCCKSNVGIHTCTPTEGWGRMEQEIERLRHDIERHIAIASEHATECERLRAELAECKRDAERYRTALGQIVAPFEDLNFVSGNKLLTYIHDVATAALAAKGDYGCLGPTIYLVEDNNAPEKRCCDECGHKGTDGGSTTESYCGSCGATVPYPEDDLCSECGATSCMLIACPECGGHYSLDEEQGDDIETPKSAANARQMREEYRGASCDDVARRVDECMRLRTAIQRALDDSESGNG